jgi:hypothetical protein
MAHFAQIDDNNIVTQVIVIEQGMVDTGLWGDPAKWIQTSYNTRGGIHYGSNDFPDGGVALRKNFAGIGYTYDVARDAFYSPKPYASWVLNEDTCLWEAPVPYPVTEENTFYTWDEATTSWVAAA